MALDPDVAPAFAALLDEPRNMLRRPPPHVSMTRVRQAADAVMAAVEPPPIHAVEDLIVPGPAGDLRLRFYRPGPPRDGCAVIYLHGGGFALGSLDTHEAICRELALRADMVVVAVDYRLAPETPFPGAVEDGMAALRQVVAHAAGWGLDPNRIAVCGDSAGGNLAVAVALSARTDGPAITHLGLIYPVVDPACDSASMQALAEGYVLTRDAVRWFWDLYLGAAEDRRPPLAALLDADLDGLPPTTVLTAEFDPLRDEGEILASALRRAGVPVAARRYLGMIHGFVGMSHLTPVAYKAIADLANDLNASLRSSPLATGLGVRQTFTTFVENQH